MRAESRWLVEESWRRLEPVREQAAELFFRRLAAGDPEDLTGFRGLERREYRAQLLDYVDTVIRGLERLQCDGESSETPEAESTGDEERLARIADALVWTLQISLKSRFTDRACEAWTEALRRFVLALQAAGPARGSLMDRPAA